MLILNANKIHTIKEPNYKNVCRNATYYEELWDETEKYIDINQNPYTCNSQLFWIGKKMSNKPDQMWGLKKFECLMLYMDNAHCYQPEQLQNQSILAVAEYFTRDQRSSDQRSSDESSSAGCMMLCHKSGQNRIAYIVMAFILGFHLGY